MRTTLRRAAATGVAAAMTLGALASAPLAGAATAPLLPYADTGDLYFADDGTDSILKRSAGGVITTAVANALIKQVAGTTTVEFAEPTLAFDAAGNLLFTIGIGAPDVRTYSIFRLAPDGTLTEHVAGADVYAVTGGTGILDKFALGPDGSIFLVAETTKDLVKISPSGQVTMLASTEQLAAAANLAPADFTLDANPIVDEAGNVYLAKEGPASFFWKITPTGSITVLQDQVNEFQTVSVSGTAPFTLSFGGEPTTPLTSASTAAQVEAALEALADLSDVEVTGLGTAANPWLIEFVAPGDRNLSALVASDPSTVTVTQVYNGGKLSNVDTFVTRDAAGNITIVDDGKNWILTREPDGDVTSLLTPQQLRSVIGDAMSLEAGLAWGDDGRLYVADSGTDGIYAFQTGGQGTQVVTAAQIAAVTGRTAVLVGGIAFAPEVTASGGGGTGGGGTGGGTGGGDTGTGGGDTGTGTGGTGTGGTGAGGAGTGTGTSGQTGSSLGYVLVDRNGAVSTFGTGHHGDLAGIALNQPVIGITMTPTGEGYWLVARDGGIFTFGDAGFFGSMGDQRLNAPILGVETTPTGRGYWLFAADGGIFTFGDAEFFGSTGDLRLNAPIIGMETTGAGDGYWLVAQDGGIFTFGNAPFHGSTGDLRLNQPVFDMASTVDGSSYWLVARDGGIFTFPETGAFYGSAVGQTAGTVIGMRDTPTGGGYWIADSAGAVSVFGDAPFLGDLRGQPLSAPIVGFAIG